MMVRGVRREEKDASGGRVPTAGRLADWDYVLDQINALET